MSQENQLLLPQNYFRESLQARKVQIVTVFVGFLSPDFGS